jgi:hypothetical protein
MKGTVLTIQMIQPVPNSYITLQIKKRLKLEFVQAREIQDHLLSALKKQIQKDIASTLMIQSSARP